METTRTPQRANASTIAHCDSAAMAKAAPEAASPEGTKLTAVRTDS
ncbi:hypothetical protein [Pseudarthrobacter sulfonivorans]|nr:hypothetical protein [Pseudarthrobacter sulfonivorans]MDR6413473.1 hypothetical protein [Pseudarthrobacter sulfonivorans]